MSTIRCVCAAALARARAEYGHLEDQQVWVSHADDPGAYRGTLQILTRRPGSLWIDRAGGRGFAIHIDDVGSVTPA